MSNVKRNHPYKHLAVWQKSYELALAVYRVTKSFPKHEIYGVTSQLRRSAVSVPANIVEGQAKATRKDFLRYLSIARGSLNETGFFLELSRDLEYLSTDDYAELLELKNKAGFLLHRFTMALRCPKKPTQPRKPTSLI